MQPRIVIGGVLGAVALAAGIYASTTLGQSGRQRDARQTHTTAAPATEATPSLTPHVATPASDVASAPVGHAPPAYTVVRASGPIAWQNSFDAAKSNVKSDQVIFVDVYTDWCGWCKLMDERVYTDRSVQKFAAKQVFVKLNAEDNGEGTEFARRVHVRGFPTLLVFSHDGQLIASKPGAFQRPDDFLSWIQSATARR